MQHATVWKPIFGCITTTRKWYKRVVNGHSSVVGGAPIIPTSLILTGLFSVCACGSGGVAVMSLRARATGEA